MIDTIISTTEKLVNIYENKDGARKDEIAPLGGQTATGTNVFSAFYDRLKEIRESHRRHPAARVIDTSDVYEAMLNEEPVIEFTGEEASGRYLDLHDLYNQHNNLKFEKPIDYSTCLDVFSQPHIIPRNMKFSRQYREYMENLLVYLIYFLQWTNPCKILIVCFQSINLLNSWTRNISQKVLVSQKRVGVLWPQKRWTIEKKLP